MPKRDPRKTARNKLIKEMTTELRAMQKRVLNETGLANELSLNATIGHKTDYFIDLKHQIINSPEHYVELWMEGFKANLKGWGGGYQEFFEMVKASPAMLEYLDLFLRRSYLKHYEELYKARPHETEAEIWIGQNHADYGLLVAPRFAKGDWENDKSEIRHFKPRYWSIGHVLETGLVVPGKKDVMEFGDVDDYLKFFENVLVRGTKSSHQEKIAEMYSEYVRDSGNPRDVPLLIPEFRYGGKVAKHQHRLDFCVIDPDTMDKVGFELSPWSSHGMLTGTKGKSQKQINAEAQANFDKDMKKHKNFYKQHGVFALIYTDTDLAKPKTIFADIQTRLEANHAPKQLSFSLMKNFFK